LKSLTADFQSRLANIAAAAIASYGSNMPIYVLKHYHKAVPSKGKVWLLAREIAFDVPNDATAIMIARKRLTKEFGPLGDLAIITDQNGKRVWEYDVDL